MLIKGHCLELAYCVGRSLQVPAELLRFIAVKLALRCASLSQW